MGKYYWPILRIMVGQRVVVVDNKALKENPEIEIGAEGVIVEVGAYLRVDIGGAMVLLDVSEVALDDDMRDYELHAAALRAKEILEWGHRTENRQRHLPGEKGKWLFVGPVADRPPAQPMHMDYLRSRGLLRYPSTLPDWVQIADWGCGDDPEPFTDEQLAVQPATGGAE